MAGSINHPALVRAKYLANAVKICIFRGACNDLPMWGHSFLVVRLPSFLLNRKTTSTSPREVGRCCFTPNMQSLDDITIKDLFPVLSFFARPAMDFNQKSYFIGGFTRMRPRENYCQRSLRPRYCVYMTWRLGVGWFGIVPFQEFPIHRKGEVVACVVCSEDCAPGILVPHVEQKSRILNPKTPGLQSSWAVPFAQRVWIIYLMRRHPGSRSPSKPRVAVDFLTR